MELQKQNIKTSWQEVSSWYDKSVGNKGHYYHRHVIIPGVLRLLNLKKGDSLLDLACGNGVLVRHIPKGVSYHGIDASESLIKYARQNIQRVGVTFQQEDITQSLQSNHKQYTHVSIILALQNVEDPKKVFENAASQLKDDGKFIIVINHPYFRIPRFSKWGVDEKQKLQYRRIDRYMSSLSIPITAHPGKSEESPVTWSFHNPLSTYTIYLKKAGFVIEVIEEWNSDKTSVGKKAKMENRGRNEFPLFMTILARKIS